MYFLVSLFCFVSTIHTVYRRRQVLVESRNLSKTLTMTSSPIRKQKKINIENQELKTRTRSVFK